MDKTLTESGNIRKIAFTGGGTGGHVYPNLALIPEFARQGFDAVYIGGEGNSVARKLAEEAGIRFFGVPTVKLVRSLSPAAIANNLKIPSALHKAVKAAGEALDAISPAAVFSKGGYASLPAVLAASKRNIPIFAHESDMTLGLANKIAAKKGAVIFKANPAAKFDGIAVGMPLREELFSVQKSAARARLGLLNCEKPVLLILGGSSGAKYLNDATARLLDELRARFVLLHVGGKNGSPCATDSDDYRYFPYASRVADFYAASDVVLSRAGATAVYEISALEKRAVFVPLPKGISRGDQLQNAELAAAYGGRVLWQGETFFARLIPLLEEALQNPPMTPVSSDANGKIVRVVCDTLRRGELWKDKKHWQNGLQ